MAIKYTHIQTWHFSFDNSNIAFLARFFAHSCFPQLNISIATCTLCDSFDTKIQQKLRNKHNSRRSRIFTRTVGDPMIKRNSSHAASIFSPLFLGSVRSLRIRNVWYFILKVSAPRSYAIMAFLFGCGLREGRGIVCISKSLFQNYPAFRNLTDTVAPESRRGYACHTCITGLIFMGFHNSFRNTRRI